MRVHTGSTRIDYNPFRCVILGRLEENVFFNPESWDVLTSGGVRIVCGRDHDGDGPQFVWVQFGFFCIFHGVVEAFLIGKYI